MSNTYYLKQAVEIKTQLLAALSWSDANPLKQTVIRSGERALFELEKELKRVEALKARNKLEAELAARPWYVRLFSFR